MNAQIINGSLILDGRKVAEILPCLIEENGTSQPADKLPCYIYNEETSDLGDGLFLITRSVTNRDTAPHTCKFHFDLKTAFRPDRYLIPAVSYNGNYIGEGLEPKGMTAPNGEPWVHSFRRTSVPSCSVTENENISVSLFASANTKESLVSSVSLMPSENGEIIQRIIWPVTEAPQTYYENDRYNERLDTFVTLEPGCVFAFSAYILVARPRWKNYGCVALLDRALDIFPFSHGPSRSPEEVYRLGMKYLRTLLTECKGDLLFSTGSFPSEGGLALSDHFEVGWCGQNIMNAKMLILEGFRKGTAKLVAEGIEVCENWLKKQSDSGLVLAHYEWYTEGRNWNYHERDRTKSWAANVDYVNGWLPETCNTAWAACEMIQVWKILRDNGTEKPEFRDFAVKILDFFCDHYSPEYAFGMAWHFDGRCEQETGTIGLFMTMALCEGYRILGSSRYLDFAAKSLDFYFRRDIDKFECSAGAIDCTCIDKETAGPAIISALDLYEFTKDAKWLEYALKAAYYFTSWMFHYDAYYGPEAEFTQYGYYTSGSTAVSVQHPALDQWGELMCCEYLRLADITGDDKWRRRAVMMWYNATQCISDENNHVFHGKKRPAGSQNEAFYQARWGHRKNCNEYGHLNDWLVSWVNIFRLNVLYRLDTRYGESGRDSLR